MYSVNYVLSYCLLAIYKKNKDFFLFFVKKKSKILYLKAKMRNYKNTIKYQKNKLIN